MATALPLAAQADRSARASALPKEPVPERLALDRITRRGVWNGIAAAASVAALPSAASPAG